MILLPEKGERFCYTERMLTLVRTALGFTVLFLGVSTVTASLEELSGGGINFGVTALGITMALFGVWLLIHLTKKVLILVIVVGVILATTTSLSLQSDALFFL